MTIYLQPQLVKADGVEVNNDLVQRLRNHTGSNLAREAADELCRLDELRWIPWFAWYPVKTIKDQLVWMTSVQRAWDWSINTWGYAGYSGTDGGWIYRIPKT